MRRISLVVLLSLCAPAHAWWMYGGTSDDGQGGTASAYINPNTKRKTPDGYQVWTLVDNTREGNSEKRFQAYDCTSPRVATLVAVHYKEPMARGAAGPTLRTLPPDWRDMPTGPLPTRPDESRMQPPEWRDIRSGSPEAHLFKLICPP